MTRIGLVEANSLVGQNLRETFEAESDFDLTLLGVNAGDYATLAEVRGEAAVVLPLSVDNVDGVSVAVLAGSGAEQATALEIVQQQLPCIIAASDFEHPAGLLRVSGVNDGIGVDAPLVVSPHPAVLILTHLAAALAEHEPERISATILMPASTRGEAGLHELFEQTRSILNFTDDQPRQVFGAQLAFNLLPGPDPTRLCEQVGEILPQLAEVDAHLLLAPIFHSVAASLVVDLSPATGLAEIESALAASDALELAESPATLGPIDAAGGDEIQVCVTSCERGSVRLWAVMDNLKLGSSNALDLVRQGFDTPADE